MDSFLRRCNHWVVRVGEVAPEVAPVALGAFSVVALILLVIGRLDNILVWPLGLVAILALAAFLMWLRSRARGLGRVPADPEDELAAYTVAFMSLLLVAAGTALVSPYTLVFVLPSLYTWLWLPQLRASPGWVTDVLYGVGLLGPVIALVVLAEQLDLGARAPLYAASLMTTGVVPWGATLALTVWAAIAGLVGAVASGAYAPAVPSRGR